MAGVMIYGSSCMLGQLKSSFEPEKCISRGRGVIHGAAEIGQNYIKSMVLTFHVVEVIKWGCYGWGHIIRIRLHPWTYPARKKRLMGFRGRPWLYTNWQK